MTLQISIPKSDLAKSIPVSKGWHLLEITSVEPKPSKDKQSVNYVFLFKVEKDPNERELEHYFNSKALGMINGLIAAVQNKSIQEVLDGITSGTITLDLHSFIGKKVMGNVDQQMFDGRIVNKITDFAHPDKVPF